MSLNGLSIKGIPKVYVSRHAIGTASAVIQDGGGERSNLGKINSKAKGAKGERELAKLLGYYGYDTRRGQQFCGANGDADVVGLPGIHIECKRVERLNIYEAMEQAERDSCGKEIPFLPNRPTVFHRKNNHPWLVTMRLEDWIVLYREWEAGNALEQE